jgi:hypothetical protein
MMIVWLLHSYNGHYKSDGNLYNSIRVINYSRHMYMTSTVQLLKSLIER